LGWAFGISAAMVFLPKSSREYLTPDFIRHLSVLQILLYAWYQNIHSRLKYQAAWYYGEAGCISAGFGYEAEHKNHRGVTIPGGWHNVQQCDYIGVELSTNIQSATTFWNQGVSRFLKNYVYTRFDVQLNSLAIPFPIIPRFSPIVVPCPPSNSRLLPLLMTFTVSAIWHGLYFGYFSMFIIIAVMAQAHKMWDEKVRPRVFSDAKDIKHPQRTLKYYIYTLLSWFSLHFFMANTMAGFHLLSLQETWFWSKSTYHIGLITDVLYYLFVALMPRIRQKRDPDPKSNVKFE